MVSTPPLPALKVVLLLTVADKPALTLMMSIALSTKAKAKGMLPCLPAIVVHVAMTCPLRQSAPQEPNPASRRLGIFHRVKINRPLHPCQWPHNPVHRILSGQRLG